jgi:hypothetical protein
MLEFMAVQWILLVVFFMKKKRERVMKGPQMP